MADITLQNNQSLTLRLKACGLSSADIKKVLAALSPELENKANTDLENVDVEAFKAKADAAGVGDGGITKEEVVDLINSSHSAVVFPRLNEIEANLENKADKVDVYTKEEINERIGDMENALDYIIMVQERYYDGESGTGGSRPGGDA